MEDFTVQEDPSEKMTQEEFEEYCVAVARQLARCILSGYANEKCDAKKDN